MGKWKCSMESMNRKKILLTGPGFIGFNVLQALVCRDEYEIHVVSHHDISIKNINIHNVDLLNPNDRQQLFSYKFDAMIHLAWYCGKGLHGHNLNIDWCIATLDLLKHFVQNGGKHFLGIGSVSEYDFRYGYFDELNTPLNNNSIYGKSKAACYELCKKYCSMNDVLFQWARIFNVFGINEKPQRLMPSIINSILDDKDILVSDCTKQQDYSYVKDVSNAIVSLFNSNVDGPVNICSGKPILLKDIVYMICDKMNYPKNKIKFGAIPSSFNDAFICGNNSRLMNEVKYQYQYNLDSGLNEMIQHMIQEKIKNEIDKWFSKK